MTAVVAPGADVPDDTSTGTSERTTRLAEARTLFEQVALAVDFPDFLTLPAYDLVVEGPR